MADNSDKTKKPNDQKGINVAADGNTIKVSTNPAAYFKPTNKGDINPKNGAKVKQKQICALQ